MERGATGVTVALVQALVRLRLRLASPSPTVWGIQALALQATKCVNLKRPVKSVNLMGHGYLALPIIVMFAHPLVWPTMAMPALEQLRHQMPVAKLIPEAPVLFSVTVLVVAQQAHLPPTLPAMATVVQEILRRPMPAARPIRAVLARSNVMGVVAVPPVQPLPTLPVMAMPALEQLRRPMPVAKLIPEAPVLFSVMVLAVVQVVHLPPTLPAIAMPAHLLPTPADRPTPAAFNVMAVVRL